MTTAKPTSFPQRVCLASWGVGLLLTPLKAVGAIDLTWSQATFPLWGGSLLFIAWGLLFKAVRSG